MPIFDISRIRRKGWTADELADELALVLDAANKGVKAPLIIRCTGNEPAIKALMPDADLAEVPPIQVRSGGQTYGVPAWPTTWNPNPLDVLAGQPDLQVPPIPPPWGQGQPVIDSTASATLPNPQETGWWQPPMPALGKVVSGSSPTWTCDIFLSEPTGSYAYMQAPAYDLNGSLALVAGDWVTLTLTFPASLQGGCLAWIAQG